MTAAALVLPAAALAAAALPVPAAALALPAAALAALAAAALALELRRRAELAARAAHELRGPLTAAGLALHALRRGAGGREGRGPAPAALAALAEQLERAALAVADVERAAAGRAPALRRATVDVAALLDAQLAAWLAPAAARGRVVRVTAVAPRVAVTGDPRLLRQAMSNLVANALEHGGGDVLLAARRRGARLRLEVRDAGRPAGPWRRHPALGVPPARALTAALTAVLRAGRRRRGHGLRVAADVAARHGGRLLLARAGGGTVAIVELPLPAAGRGTGRARRPRARARTTRAGGARVPA